MGGIFEKDFKTELQCHKTASKLQLKIQGCSFKTMKLVDYNMIRSYIDHFKLF